MKKVLSVLVLVLLSVCCLAGCKKNKEEVAEDVQSENVL